MATEEMAVQRMAEAERLLEGKQDNRGGIHGEDACSLVPDGRNSFL
jgi:hypothetical protein